MAVHELGHAGAARALRVPVGEIALGSGRPRLQLRVGRTWLRVRMSRPLRHIAYIAHAPTTRRNCLLIAASGPLASLLSAAAADAALLATRPGPGLQDFLGTLVSLGLVTGVGGLAPWSGDGRTIRLAWRSLRAPEPQDPNAATSVPPPASSPLR